MGKPKVIIVGKLPPPYIGPAVATNILLNSKLNEKYELFHLNTTVNKTVKEFGKGKLKKVGKNLKIYIRLFLFLRKNKPELILIPISQTTLGFLKDSIFILLSAFFPIKILLQLRGSNFKNWMNSSSGITRRFVRFCLNRTSGIVVLGNNLKHLFEDYYPEDKIHVVPNGCDINIPESNLKSEKVQLLYFANFLPTKGIKEVLEALLILKEKGYDQFKLNAVGAWDNEEYRHECKRLIDELGDLVDFHAPMSGDQKWQTFANAEIFLFTPNSPEGHPWVIVEALSARLPIISTDQGAIVESVIHLQNGYIVESSNPTQIASSLEELLIDSKKRIEFGKRSQIQYQNNFTENQMVENMSNVFNTILC